MQILCMQISCKLYHCENWRNFSPKRRVSTGHLILANLHQMNSLALEHLLILEDYEISSGMYSFDQAFVSVRR